MELRHLRYFIAVAEETTLVAAAKRLRISQPALTRQIDDLESEIGVDLFERGPHGVEPTPAGEVCLVTARHILAQLEAAILHARASSKGVAGRCVVSVGARSLASGLVTKLVAHVQEAFPAIELVVTEGVGFRQWDALQVLDVDIALGFPANTDYPDLASETLDYDVFDSVLVPTSHELAGRANVALADLTEGTFLTWKSSLLPEFIRQQQKEFARAGFTPARTRAFDDIVSIASMVTAGQGWTLFPGNSRGLSIPGSTVIPLDDFTLPMPHAVVSRRGEERPVVRTVLGIVRRLMSAERSAAGRGPGAPPTPVRISIEIAAVVDEPAGERAIELRHLRYFCAVADASSFGRAAERLGITQPALSRQVRDLEQAVGVSLLDRAARGATVSAAGESFCRSGKRILHEAAALPAEAQRARRGMMARCVIAAVPTTRARALLRELVLWIGAQMPQLLLSVEDFHTPDQPAALRSARVDVGLCHASPLSPIEERGLLRERLVSDVVNCALVAADSPLATRSAIAFRDLADIPFIFASRTYQPGLYDQVFAIFDERSFRPRVDRPYDGLQTMWTMVADGRGWGIGFDSQRAAPPQGTVAVPVSGFAMPWGIDVLYREDESRTLILLVLDQLRDIARAQEKQSAVA